MRNLFLLAVLFILGCLCVSQVSAQELSAEEIVARARKTRKADQKDIQSYRLNTYSKAILRIADPGSDQFETRGITLRHAEIHWKAPDLRHEIITAQRHLKDLKWFPYEPFDLGLIMDFGLNRITVGSVSVVGPLSSDGKAAYRFSMAGSDSGRSKPCYLIQVDPQDRYQPLMQGLLWITKDDFHLARVEVRFNESVKIFPQPKYWTLTEEFDRSYGMWLPVHAKWTMKLDLNLIAWKKKAQWTNEYQVVDAAVNGTVDETIFGERLREISPDAQFKDSTFWNHNQIIPLSPQESLDFERLSTIGKNLKVVYPDIESFEAKQREEDVHVGFRFTPDGRYNRVEGFYGGAELGLNHFSFRQIIRDLTLKASYGYGFADKKYKYSGEIMKGFLRRSFYVGARYYNDLTFKELTGNFLSNSVAALLYRYDGLNYFYTRGFDVFTRWKPSYRWQTEIRYSDRLDKSTELNTSYALIKRYYAFEPVYPITEGRLRRLSSSSTLKIGDGIGIAARDPYWIINGSMEYSDENLLKSDFHYSRYYGSARFHFPTTRRGSLDGKLYLGYGTDRVPQQYLFDLAGEYPPYRMKTTDILESEGNHFAGNYMAQICIEHNFGGTLLEKTGLPYLKNGDVDITPFVNVGYVRLTKLARATLAYPGIRDMDKPLVETGFGIGDIHRLIRIDFAWRLTRRQIGNRNFSIVINVLLQHQ